MKLPLFIARRYLISRKSYNIINIISGISVAGITVGTMALIIILSVFNGFENIVTKLFNSFDPDLLITVKEGKVFDPSRLPAETIRNIPGVIRYTEVVEENALLKYGSKQYIATIKGVSEDYEKYSGLDSMLVEGELVLQKGARPFMVLGYGVSYYLGVNLSAFDNSIYVYVPKRTKKTLSSIDQAFNSGVITPSGIFSIQQDFDSKYVLVPVGFARTLLEYTSEVTAIEIGLASWTDKENIQEQVKQLCGDDFSVKNRYQQQELLYKMMKSEKLAIYFILGFILLIATFNVVGSLSMLILDKRKDIGVIWSMGASNTLIKRIFLAEGLMISLSGALLGLLLGAMICWIQQRFGIIKLEAGSGSFIIDAYPVRMQVKDFLLVFLTVMIIGMGSAWYPVRQISKKYLQQKLS
ncbi:MAG: ABC transporter permease [Bacteroidetes bacterium]|nr:ABC transporter permease [Bacteroidota bacterium]